MNRRKSTRTPVTPPGHLKRFGARILDDPRHDPYQAAGKYAEPTRRIGEALKHAHDGDLRIEFGKDAYEIGVHW
jgi:hypothetical protein